MLNVKRKNLPDLKGKSPDNMCLETNQRFGIQKSLNIKIKVHRTEFLSQARCLVYLLIVKAWSGMALFFFFMKIVIALVAIKVAIAIKGVISGVVGVGEDVDELPKA
jgi:hypothetical protein